MFRRELGHIRRPLALGLVRAVVGVVVGGGMFLFVLVCVFVGGEAEGRGGLLGGECEA